MVCRHDAVFINKIKIVVIRKGFIRFPCTVLINIIVFILKQQPAFVYGTAPASEIIIVSIPFQPLVLIHFSALIYKVEIVVIQETFVLLQGTVRIHKIPGAINLIPAIGYAGIFLYIIPGTVMVQPGAAGNTAPGKKFDAVTV